MDLFAHLIYEYRKKVRSLALYTFPVSDREHIEKRLRSQRIDYWLQFVTPKKMNVFFGEVECVNIIRNFGKKQLNEYTPEEDFILGIMLGYDRLQQCRRYIDRFEQDRNDLQLQIIEIQN